MAEYHVTYRCDGRCYDCDPFADCDAPGCWGTGKIELKVGACDIEDDDIEKIASLDADDLCRFEIETESRWTGTELVAVETVPCPHCEGTGRNDYYDDDDCPCEHCYGFGRLCPHHIEAEQEYEQHLARLRAAFAGTILDLAECPF